MDLEVPEFPELQQVPAVLAYHDRLQDFVVPVVFVPLVLGD